MLYESDSSVDEEEEEEEDELLGDQPTTSYHGTHRSQEIFTIHMLNGNHDNSTPMNHGDHTVPKTFRYSQLEPNDDIDNDDDDAILSRQPSLLTSRSLSNLQKARTFLNKQVTYYKTSKSDTQCNRINHSVKIQIKPEHSGKIQIKPERLPQPQQTPEIDSVSDSDGDVTLTPRGEGRRGCNRWSYISQGSGILSAWSTYSELLLEHNGASWDCCVALVVRVCASDQCHAYIKLLKMAAWFIMFILVLMCFRSQFYHTTYSGTWESPPGKHPSGLSPTQHDSISLMDAIHGTHQES